jgi:hypothetical protein
MQTQFDNLKVDLARGYTRMYARIQEPQCDEARTLGLALHYAQDTRTWYCATQAWVEWYHRSGGLWAYAD